VNKTITIDDRQEDMEIFALIVVVDDLIDKLEKDDSHAHTVLTLKTLTRAVIDLYGFYKESRGASSTTFNLH